MNQDWSIQSRGVACSVTGIPFEAGQYFHTLLFDDKTVLRREDLSEEAFKQRAPDAPQPFSHWRSKFEPAPPKAPEALGKQTAEDLLRKYMADPNPGLANVRYILALMLERKRQLKELEVRKNEDGSLTRIYQHGKSGEVFVIPDPGLKLSQVAEVQSEVADLLAAPATAPAAEAEAVEEAVAVEAEASTASQDSANPENPPADAQSSELETPATPGGPQENTGDTTPENNESAQGPSIEEGEPNNAEFAELESDSTGELSHHELPDHPAVAPEDANEGAMEEIPQASTETDAPESV
jgi:hypothetical protein